MADINAHINPDLCFIFINNFLQNAIGNNIQNEVIEINPDAKHLFIFNTAKGLQLNTKQMFESFKKKSDYNDSSG